VHAQRNVLDFFLRLKRRPSGQAPRIQIQYQTSPIVAASSSTPTTAPTMVPVLLDCTSSPSPPGTDVEYVSNSVVFECSISSYPIVIKIGTVGSEEIGKVEAVLVIDVSEVIFSCGAVSLDLSVAAPSVAN
jgi:hypothetical protein